MLPTAMDGDELIHDAAASTDEFVFRSLAKQGELARINCGGRDCRECRGNRYLDGGRRTESRTKRNGAADQQIRARDSIAGLIENLGDAQDVVTPLMTTGGLNLVEREFNLLLEVDGAHNQLAVVPGRDCHPCEEIDGGGHHKATVVVSVLANEIHTPGRLIDDGRLTEQKSKRLFDLLNDGIAAQRFALNKKGAAEFLLT